MEAEEFNKSENIQHKLQEFLGQLPDNFSILEEQVDVDTQMEYFNLAKQINRNIPDKEITARKKELYSDEIDIKTKKELLILFAGIDSPEAFRIIEKYKKDSENTELYDWACIAYHESKMLLESSLLGQSHVFISTGMGGKGSDLRYFIVLISENKDGFNNIQKKLIKGEVEYSLSKHKAEIEEINFEGKFTTLTCLIPLEAPIKDIFQEAIDECNQLGNFISENFIVTNVKKLNTTEIDEFLRKSEIDGSEGEIDINYT